MSEWYPSMCIIGGKVELAIRTLSVNISWIFLVLLYVQDLLKVPNFDLPFEKVEEENRKPRPKPHVDRIEFDRVAQDYLSYLSYGVIRKRSRSYPEIQLL